MEVQTGDAGGRVRSDLAKLIATLFRNRYTSLHRGRGLKHRQTGKPEGSGKVDVQYLKLNQPVRIKRSYRGSRWNS